MDFKVEDIKDRKVIRCNSDKLDSLVAPKLKSIFVHHSNEGCSSFIIDLSMVKYCDSSGLSALLVGNRILKEKKGTLTLFGLNPMVSKIISISQLDTVFKIVNNEENALKK